MACRRLRVVQLVSAVVLLFATQSNAQTGPTHSDTHVTLQFPPQAIATGVQIHAILSGSFGGHGDIIRTQPGVSQHALPASVNGIPATKLKALVYMPGCQLARVKIKLGEASVQQPLKCFALPETLLQGRIEKDAASVQPSALFEVQILYKVNRSNRFLDIADGPVTTFMVAIAPINDDLTFSVSLPQLNQDPFEIDALPEDKGEFSLLVRDKKTGNIFGELKPSQFATWIGGIELHSRYPPNLSFSLQRWQK
jgi:hypothetical protein